MNVSIFGLVLVFLIGLAPLSFSHTTVHVEQYEIEAGWGTEPPVVGILNTVVFKIVEPGESDNAHRGTLNAFKNLESTIMYGGAAKKLDILSDVRPGYYYSPIIPTKTGSYVVLLDGKINDVSVNVEIPVEDIESTSLLDFPPSSADSTDIASIKNSISSIQQDVLKLKSGETSVSSDGGAAYDFAIFGLSIASAAIILAIVSLVKRK